MYQVKFLKPISFAHGDGKKSVGKKPICSKKKSSFSLISPQSQQHFLLITTLLTVVNDLGELLYCGDLKVKVDVRIYQQNSKDDGVVRAFPSKFLYKLPIISSSEMSWKSGYRTMEVDLEIPVSLLNTLTIQHKQDQDIYAIVTAEVVPDSYSDFDLVMGSDDSTRLKVAQDSYKIMEGLSSPIFESKVLKEKNFQFLPVTSLPLKIITKNTYCTNGPKISTERISMRYLPIYNKFPSDNNCSDDFFSKQDIMLIEELSHGIARHLWDAGTGIGLVSISLSKIFEGNTRIVATDLEDAREICVENIQLNNSNGKTSIEFHEFEWESAGNNSLSEKHQCWDFIVITDCTYNSSYYNDLNNAILKESGKETIVLLAHKFRDGHSERKFFEMFRKNFILINQYWFHFGFDSIHIGTYKKI
ncbi:hypothetical protein PACTADRAFT_5129 [Pachysolen tannophilus NRRL Y-2460]|uniref:Uncharacterized protein n=1 Tax=Pachysolen tannophilus NRRL Y-2460 TaxID=669874 RepID=A0A1E4TNP7_PACTA|nr:hypothetical protein PACTADRAFT_5129 [Pachysolen tannophilus NRRL Y-2460]